MKPKKHRVKKPRREPLRIPEKSYATAGTDAYVKEFYRLNWLKPVEYTKNG